jgi:hypothetical protein
MNNTFKINCTLILILFASLMSIGCSTDPNDPVAGFMNAKVSTQDGIYRTTRTVEEVVEALENLEMDDDSGNHKFLGWEKLPKGYRLRMMGGMAYQLEFYWEGGDTAFVAPMRMIDGTTIPASLFLDRLIGQ